MRPRSFVSIAALVLAAFTVGTAGQTPTREEQPAQEKLIVRGDRDFKGPRQLDVEFPDVEGWQLSGRQNYPTPDMGYSVNYESRQGGRVTVYVYNAGRSDVPNSLTGVVLEEFENSGDAIISFASAGSGSAELVTSDTITLGGKDGTIKTLRAVYELRSGGNRLRSELYVFPYKDNFIKIRATRLYEDLDTVNPSIERLFGVLDKLFSE